jgi:hypothetical protein
MPVPMKNFVGLVNPDFIGIAFRIRLPVKPLQD